MNPPVLYVDDPNHVMPQAFLAPEIYAEAITSMIVVCTDIMIVDSSKRTVWLAHRIAKPMSTWWFLGGRALAGETEYQSVARNFQRETELVLPEERFSYLTMHRYHFSNRQQEPQNIGADSLTYLFTLELTSEERATVSQNLHRHTGEYDASEGLKEFTREDLAKNSFHRAILNAYDLFFESI